MAGRCRELQLICSIEQTHKILDTTHKERRANRDREHFRMARDKKTLCTKKGTRTENAALKERRANRDRELFRMARE